ncbi:MAG TPA: DinB family protein [Candidatus Acidoferrum sp.]|nr:DinB family protein [Candidatus Acidoferrum sp.]
MRKSVKSWCVLAAVLVLLTCASGLRAQGTATQRKASGLAADLLMQWNYTGKQLIDMAADFPENKFDYKATSAQRTFAEQLLHAAGANYIFIDAALGTKPPKDVENPSRQMYKTRAQVVAYIKKSYADGAAAIRRFGDKGLIEEVKGPFGNQMVTRAALFAEAMEHANDHYGQCVVYYRLNGLVPPASRPQPK